MRRSDWLGLGVSALLLAACGAADQTPSVGVAPLAALALPAASGDPYPLDVGRTWVYQSIQQDDGGTPQPAPDLRFVVARGLARGVEIRRFYGNWEAPPTLAIEDAGGVQLSRFVAAGPPATDSITILRFPLAVGASWPGRHLVGATERIEVAGFGDVVVPAGRFPAWHVQHHLAYASGGTDTLDYWYAPGIGMVKAIERVTVWVEGKAQHDQVTASLKSYSAAGSPGS